MAVKEQPDPRCRNPQTELVDARGAGGLEVLGWFVDAGERAFKSEEKYLQEFEEEEGSRDTRQYYLYVVDGGRV